MAMRKGLGMPLGALRRGNPLERIVGYASSLGLNNSSEFDAQPVVHRDPQTLLAADVALGCLYRDMPEKELDLLKLAAGIMAESRTEGRRSCGARRGISILAAVFLTPETRLV